MYYGRLFMFEPEIEYPYWQPEPPLPYQPNRGYIDPSRYQQQAMVSPSATTQADIVRTARTMTARPAAAAWQQRPEQVKPTAPRMSKAAALEFVEQCKKWLVAGSIVAFGVISGLVAGHVLGSSGQAANQSNNQSAPSLNSPSTSPSNNGGFFQQGGNNFGNGNSGQQPLSGSRTS